MKKLLFLILFFAGTAFAQQGPPIVVGQTPVPVYAPFVGTTVTIVQVSGTSVAYTILGPQRDVLAQPAAGATYTFSPQPRLTFRQGEALGYIAIVSGSAVFRATAVGGGTVTSVNGSGGAISLIPGGGLTIVQGPSGTFTISAGAGTISGSIAATQVAIGTGANTIGGSGNFVVDPTSHQLDIFHTAAGSNLVLHNSASSFPATERTLFNKDTTGALFMDNVIGTTFSQNWYMFADGTMQLGTSGAVAAVLVFNPANGTFSFQNGTTATSFLVDSANFKTTWFGSTSGSASIGTAAVAGTPCTILLPTVSPTAGQILSSAAPSGSSCQTSWTAGFNPAAPGPIGGTTPSTGAFTTLTATTYNTTTNCASTATPAVCGSAAAGSVDIAAGATTLVVNTSAVTANSEIFLQNDASDGAKLSVTCNLQATATLGTPRVTARTAATSFTITIDTTPTTNPMCIDYHIVN